MSFFFTCNGRFYKEGRRIITPDSRAFKYGDGLFETLKMVKGRLMLKEYHFERLFSGMRILSFDIPPSFTPELLETEVIALAEKNGHLNTTRVRLTVFREAESLHEPENNFPNYIIQTSELPGSAHDSTGLIVDVYPHAKKSCDMLANSKTNNFLPYALAAVYAKKNGLHDCILLNNFNRICDTSVANIFIIKDQQLFTPPLGEGCIAGVMRRYILERLAFENTPVTEMPLRIEEVEEADEVFLTNSIRTVVWVKQFRNSTYTNTQSQLLYNRLNRTF